MNDLLTDKQSMNLDYAINDSRRDIRYLISTLNKLKLALHPYMMSRNIKAESAINATSNLLSALEQFKNDDLSTMFSIIVNKCS